MGASFAKALSLGLSRPLIGVNHLHAHLLAAGIEGELVFPAMGLLVSGGHTNIYLIRSPLLFEALGRTIDDAAGEAFDKIGKLMGLPYPSGRLIDALAAKGTVDRTMFRCPYMDNDNLDFSFSGLKTAAATVIAKNPRIIPAGNAADHASCCQETSDFCASLQEIIARTLEQKLSRALDRHAGVRSLIVAGGVAANSAIRSAMSVLAEKRGLRLSMPSPSLCTDNGDMVAYTGWLQAAKGGYHELSVSCVPRGTAIPDDMLFAGSCAGQSAASGAEQRGA